MKLAAEQMEAIYGSRWRQCGIKRGYRDRDAALDQVGILRALGKDRDTAPLNVYECKHCHQWHVGHYLKKKERR